MPTQGRGQEPQSPKLLPCGVWVERRWAPRRGFALPGEAAGGPRRQPSRGEPPGARGDRQHRPGRQQTRRPCPVEPQRHQAATWRTAAQSPGKRSRAPSPDWLWGRVWSRAWACQAVTPGLQTGACRRTPAVQAHHTTQGWPGTDCPGGCSGAAFAIPDPPSPPATCSKLKRIVSQEEWGQSKGEI